MPKINVYFLERKRIGKVIRAYLPIKDSINTYHLRDTVLNASEIENDCYEIEMEISEDLFSELNDSDYHLENTLYGIECNIKEKYGFCPRLLSSQYSSE